MASPENLPASLDVSGLPFGLHDSTYATWQAALSRLINSRTCAEGEKRYEFCCGYLQALQDTQAVDERLCRFLNTQLQERWIEVFTNLRHEL